MGNMWSVFSLEFKSILYSKMSVLIYLLYILLTIVFLCSQLVLGTFSVSIYFTFIFFVMVFLSPLPVLGGAVTDSWGELLLVNISEWWLLLGKYLSSILYLSLVVLVSAPTLLYLWYQYGNFDILELGLCYLGLFLSLLFFSSLSLFLYTFHLRGVVLYAVFISVMFLSLFFGVFTLDYATWFKYFFSVSFNVSSFFSYEINIYSTLFFVLYSILFLNLAKYKLSIRRGI